MKIVTEQAFIDLVNAKDGAEFVSVEIATTPAMRKTNNPFLGCTKFTTVTGILGYDYQASVNNQLMREGKSPDFIAEKRAWGERISPKWVTHKGNMYMTVKVQGSSEPVYVKDGKQIPLAEIEPFLYDKPEPQTQIEAGVEKTVKHMDVKLPNVKVIRMRGEEIMIAR